jgi:hypothetical protein
MVPLLTSVPMTPLPSEEIAVGAEMSPELLSVPIGP